MGYEVFERLCKAKGVTPYRVAKDTGVTTATLSSWKNHRYVPKRDKLQILADYFGVSVDCFTGVQTDAQSEYYYDNETLALAQELFENKQLHVLMDAAKDVDRESLAILYSLLLKMKKTNDE